MASKTAAISGKWSRFFIHSIFPVSLPSTLGTRGEADFFFACDVTTKLGGSGPAPLPGHTDATYIIPLRARPSPTSTGESRIFGCLSLSLRSSRFLRRPHALVARCNSAHPPCPHPADLIPPLEGSGKLPCLISPLCRLPCAPSNAGPGKLSRSTWRPCTGCTS